MAPRGDLQRRARKIAEQYLKKGAKVYLEGPLQTRKWTDKDGVEKYSTEVVLQGFNSRSPCSTSPRRRRRWWEYFGRQRFRLVAAGIPQACDGGWWRRPRRHGRRDSVLSFSLGTETGSSPPTGPRKRGPMTSSGGDPDFLLDSRFRGNERRLVGCPTSTTS